VGSEKEKNMKISILIACMILAASSTVYADYLDNCYASARGDYDICIQDGHGHSFCNDRREETRGHCEKGQETRNEQESRGAQYDYNGRFVPQTIPQRPTYNLPGMR
jgi:hypothetical protein